MMQMPGNGGLEEIGYLTEIFDPYSFLKATVGG
jgi:hypothetical protein